MPAAVTTTGPVVTPAGAATVRLLPAAFTTKPGAAVPLNVTCVVPAKLLPVTVTRVPGPPNAGERLEMVGPTVNVRLLLTPLGVVTSTGPVVAPAGTVTVSSVPAVFTTNPVAKVPLNVTWPASRRLLPAMATELPSGPALGESVVSTGAGTTKPAGLMAVPAGVLTRTGPLVAPAGTTKVSCVAELTVKLAAAVAFTVTRVAPVRSVPVTTTLLPTGLLAGFRLLMVGGRVNTRPLPGP